MALIVGGTTLTGTQTLDATKLSGDIADARITSSSVTQHVSATTQAKGSWTPASGGTGGGGFTVTEARYNRVGNVVHWFCWVQWTSRANNDDTASWFLTGLPITSANEGTTYAGFARLIGNSKNTHGVIPKNASYVLWARESDGRNLTIASNTGTRMDGSYARDLSNDTNNNLSNNPGYSGNMYCFGYYSV